MENQTKPGLQRALGPLVAIAVVVGTVIGSGVFKKPASVASSVPSFNWVAVVWIATGVLALLGALALAEVAVRFPRSGGNYVFLREGYGRLAGFLWGWVEFWIIRTASIAALATIFIESLHDVLRQFHHAPSGIDVLTFWEQRFLTMGIIVVLTVVNIRGVRWGGGLQFFITLVKVASLLAILFLPFFLWTSWTSPAPEPSRLPAFSYGGLGTAFLGVLWAYHGWMNVAPIAEEIKNPGRNLPLAFIGGVGVVIFLYLGANLAYHLVIPQDQMAALPRDRSVVAEFGERLLGPMGVTVAAAVVMCSVFGALNGNLLVGPRLLYAMGQDGLAPRALSGLHPKYRTPALAIAATGLWSVLLVLAGAAVQEYGLPVFTIGSWQVDLNPSEAISLFDLLTNYAMFGAVIFETLAVTTIFVFRPPFRRDSSAADPAYRCPAYPWVPLLYLVLPAFILWNMFTNQRTEVAVGSAFIALGTLVYFFIDRRPK